MGKRLTRIYTRTGDSGTTGLAGGARVAKFDQRIVCCGEVDELNSAVGVLLAEPDAGGELRATLERVQHELFEIGGELAMPEYAGLTDDSLDRLERCLDALNGQLEPLTEFILPGGNRAAAAAHMARAVCRRAERAVWALADREPVRELLPQYLNRLSDLLFVVARTLAREAGSAESSWDHQRR